MNNDITIVFLQMTGSKDEKGTGGGLIFQEFLARILIERDIDVYAITNPSDKFGFDFLNNKRFVANFHTNRNKILSFFFFNYKAMREELRKILIELPENLIFVTTDPFPKDIFAAYYIKHYFKRNIIITMHHITPSILFHPLKRGVIRATIAWIISIFALYVIKTHNIPIFLDNKRIAKSTGWRLNNLLMEMPLAVENSTIIPTNKDKFIACFIGRLSKNKGIIDLIYSWKLVNKNIPEAMLYIIGSDLGYGKYQKLINKFNLNKTVKITGYLNEKDKNEIISRSTLFVFPSYEEGWSLSVMESINSGLLPIIYRIPAYDYVCDNEIKIRPGNIKELSNKIIYFFTNAAKTKNIILKLQNCNEKYSKDYVFNIWFNQIKDKFHLD